MKKAAWLTGSRRICGGGVLCGASLASMILVVASVLGGCHEIEDYENSPKGVFEQLWGVLDEHYCFFKQKDVDWNEIHFRYGAMVSDRMTDEELFSVCSDMLDELKDGHTNLSAPFATSYYKKWWSDYPQNYDARLVEESYFNFNYRSVGGVKYGILPENVGYMHYSSFSYALGEGNLDAILGYCVSCAALIVDVRDNGGGSMTNVEMLVGRFTDKSVLAGSICHKTGPGHDDFSEPFEYYINPAGGGRVMWGKPVVVLCNRSTFSAANNFVSVMIGLPNVTVVGATTGGGSGMPFSSELVNGWGVRFSASPVRDPEGRLTEFGIEPDVVVDMNVEDALAGRDTMLDMAVEVALHGGS